jgi:hypothetical protein
MDSLAMRTRCRWYARAGFLLAIFARTVSGQEAPASLRVETHRREWVIDYGPLTLPANASHNDVWQPPALLFAAPVGGWVHGYDVQLIDAAGRRVPSGVLHHVNFIAKNRRDLFSHVMMRVGAAGPETRAIRLPHALGVSVERGDTLIMSLMLHNPTAQRYDGVHVRVHVPFTAVSALVAPISVYPFSVAIGPKEHPNIFDLPPGHSEHIWEGSPAASVRVLGLSGHLHRYGVALRLEDRTTRKILWEVHPKADSTGEVLGMPVKLFAWTLGKAMRPGHVYRLTAVYENPEPRTIVDGGMAVLGGIVVLSPRSRWPRVDPVHPEYVVDVRTTIEMSNWSSHCVLTAPPHAHEATAPDGADHVPRALPVSDRRAPHRPSPCGRPVARP